MRSMLACIARRAIDVVLALDSLVDFFAMDGHGFRCVDADAYLIAFHAKNGDGHLVADHQGLTDPAGQNQHDYYSIEKLLVTGLRIDAASPLSVRPSAARRLGPSKALPPSRLTAKTHPARPDWRPRPKAGPPSADTN